MALVPLLYLIPAAAVGVLWMLSRGEKPPGDSGGIRGQFARIGQYLYRRLPFFRKKSYGAQTALYLGILEPRMRAEEAKARYYADKLGLVLLILFMGSILSCLVSLSARQTSVMDEEGRLPRRGYGTGKYQEPLLLARTDEEGDAREVSVAVSDRQYTREEADALFEEAAAILPTAMTNGNPSLDEVRSDLILPDRLAGYPFDISWKIGNYTVIHSDGKLQTENIPEEGIVVTLTAQFAYLDYRWETTLPICAYPPRYTQEELWEREVQAALDEADRETANEPYMALPERIDGVFYTWSEKIEDNAGLLFFLLLIAAGAVYVIRDKDLEKQVREREEQLSGDYPQFASRLALYLGAGMTVRNIFCKLAGDYAGVRREGGEARFLGEELCRLVNELESGISETAAYEHFAARLRTQDYTRLCTLLTQNLKKGSSGLLPLLQEESKKALAERMDRARKRGEEAGTRLLLPMMLMLVVVMVMIMVPAYRSF